MKAEKHRCPWPGSDELYIRYHDKEWGVPEQDDKALFAKLILDGAQAGLSWITILRRTQHYFDAFDGLDPEKMAMYDAAKIESLLQNEGIIRNRLKVNAAVTNAQAYLKLIEEEGSFRDYLWQFTNGKVIVNHLRSKEDYRATSPESDAMSKALKKRGFKFVGSTICYAFMQAVGMVNDHLVTCFRHEECIKAAQKTGLALDIQ
ncbi:MAG: DNA-3-methyladenine glycosylase I [Bacteroidetes bacterium]|nr:DNA-3-methyladenine glycosylase I [Bacteroidota bacterium]